MGRRVLAGYCGDAAAARSSRWARRCFGRRGTDVRVHLGAPTYVGNGPNLLVKAIAEHAKIATPSCFGYAFKFAIPALAPIFVLIFLLSFWEMSLAGCDSRSCWLIARQKEALAGDYVYRSD